MLVKWCSVSLLSMVGTHVEVVPNGYCWLIAILGAVDLIRLPSALEKNDYSRINLVVSSMKEHVETQNLLAFNQKSLIKNLPSISPRKLVTEVEFSKRSPPPPHSTPSHPI